MNKVKRGREKTILTQYLDYLFNNNYITKSSRKYSLTPAGLSLLKDIENRLRKERHDK
jgi:predicted transcriptional regulator